MSRGSHVKMQRCTSGVLQSGGLQSGVLQSETLHMTTPKGSSKVWESAIQAYSFAPPNGSPGQVALKKPPVRGHSWESSCSGY